MAKRKRTDVVKLQLRIREGLRKQLEDTARVKDVSLNAEIVSRLEQSFVQASLREELEKLSDRIEERLPTHTVEKLEAGVAANKQRLDADQQRLDAVMAANKQLEARLTASLSDLEKLKAQLTEMFGARQSKGGKP